MLSLYACNHCFRKTFVGSNNLISLPIWKEKKYRIADRKAADLKGNKNHARGVPSIKL